MFLATRDLRRSWRRFTLVGLVVVLIAILTTVLGGLANGLVRDGTSGLRALPYTHMAFQKGAGATFSRSTLNDDTLSAFRSVNGIKATPLGASFVNAKANGPGPNIDLALFGVQADSFLLQRADARAALAGKPGLVLAGELADKGIKVGDLYTLAGSDITLPVLGFTFAGSYGHVPIAYTSLATWQKVTFGNDPHGRFSAVALKLPKGVTAEVSQLASKRDLDVINKSATYAGSPGFSAESLTMTMIRSFLLVISGLVVGAFFTVLIVQRTRQIGLLKAMGASSWYVIRDGLVQMSIVVAGASVIGALLGSGVVRAMASGSAPVELVPSTVVSGVVLLVVAGIVGSLVPLKRIAGIEPAVALGVAES